MMRLLTAGVLLAQCVVPSSAGGKVHVLTDDNYDETTKDGIWMVEFYAPWCGHCKNLQPIYEDLAEQNPHSFIQFGKVDATKESALQTRFNVRGYPRLLYKTDNGDMQTYTSARTAEGFEDWLRRMSSPSVAILASAESIDSLLLANDVIFVVAAGEEDKALAEMFELVAITERASMTFGSVKLLTSEDGGWVGELFGRERPFVAKMEKDEPPVFAPASVLNEADLLKWATAERYPLVNFLDRRNFKAVTKTEGKMTVIAVVNMEEEKQVQNAERMLKRLARPAKSPLRPDTLAKFRFGILDGIKWERFISQFFINPDMLPHVFVLDGFNGRFYEDRKVDEEDEVETFLAAVADGKVYAQREGVLGMPGRLMIAIVELDFEFLQQQPYLMLGLVAVVGAVLVGLVCVFLQCRRQATAVADPSAKED